jgi:hypothetical protein
MSAVSSFTKQPTRTAYVKTFSLSPLKTNVADWVYMTQNGQPFISPLTADASVLISGNLVVEGSISNPSDLRLKENIADVSQQSSDKLLHLKPKEYSFISDPLKKKHFGLIAQDVQKLYPELVSEVPAAAGDSRKNNLAVNYLEMVPLLLAKLKDLQSQIDDLREAVANKDTYDVY